MVSNPRLLVIQLAYDGIVQGNYGLVFPRRQIMRFCPTGLLPCAGKRKPGLLLEAETSLEPGGARGDVCLGAGVCDGHVPRARLWVDSCAGG